LQKISNGIIELLKSVISFGTIHGWPLSGPITFVGAKWELSGTVSHSKQHKMHFTLLTQTAMLSLERGQVVVSVIVLK